MRARSGMSRAQAMLAMVSSEAGLWWFSTLRMVWRDTPAFSARFSSVMLCALRCRAISWPRAV